MLVVAAGLEGLDIYQIGLIYFINNLVNHTYINYLTTIDNNQGKKLDIRDVSFCPTCKVFIYNEKNLL